MEISRTPTGFIRKKFEPGVSWLITATEEDGSGTFLSKILLMANQNAA